jgi:hypothetical protein
MILTLGVYFSKPVATSLHSSTLTEDGLDTSTDLKWLPTEYTEWQRTLSGVLSIMMEKLALAGMDVGCTPTPFHYIYHQVQSCGVCSS